MIDFVDTPPFRRIALWVVMETMHLNEARINLLVGTIFGAQACGPMNEDLPWGSKVGQIVYQGISNMIYFPVFSNFSSFFAFFCTPPLPQRKSTIFPWIFRTFFL